MAGGGGHEPNLTPLVDLFSVLIVFLLIAAAWTQLESFQVEINEKPKLNPDMTSQVAPPDQEDEKKLKLTLELLNDRVIAKENESASSFEIQGLDVKNPRLIALLDFWRQKSPPDQQIIISTQAGASYGQLIKLYDLVQVEGWENVAISPY